MPIPRLSFAADYAAGSHVTLTIYISFQMLLASAFNISADACYSSSERQYAIRQYYVMIAEFAEERSFHHTASTPAPIYLQHDVADCFMLLPRLLLQTYR
jgi:hypothetical protein